MRVLVGICIVEMGECTCIVLLEASIMEQDSLEPDYCRGSIRLWAAGWRFVGAFSIVIALVCLLDFVLQIP